MRIYTFFFMTQEYFYNNFVNFSHKNRKLFIYKFL